MSTSALGTNDFCARVRAKWGTLVPLALVARADHNIGLCIFLAMERLAKKVKNSDERHLLVKEIPATPASGVIDLTAADFDGAFIDTLRLPGHVTPAAESSVVFKHAPSLDALRATTPTDPNCVWFNLTGKKLTFKHPTTGALNTYAVALTLRASYVPALGVAARPLPDTLEGRLVDEIADIVKGLGGADFLTMDEDLAKAAAAA